MASVVETTDWLNCYDDSWKGIIVDEAFAHPAKISYALAQRIYEHAFKAGWLKPGDTVVDPFGGIGGTAIHAATHGVKWIGCELEPKFHAMAEQNFALWQDRWGMIPEWVQPVMHCGDSRRLVEVLGMAEMCVSSPPYSESLHTNESTKKDCDRLARKGLLETRKRLGEKSSLGNQGYSDSPGQLGSMREGDIAAVLASPPYAESVKGFHEERETAQESRDKRSDYAAGGSLGKSQRFGGYGQTPGQLGAMVVGSPPYEGSLECHEDALGAMQRRLQAKGLTKQECAILRQRADGCMTGYQTYTEGKLGTGETFWQAARDIVIQCHMILRPGGHAIWVCKDFVRKGARVPFSDQWLALCEAIGFRLECRHRAMLVKRGRKQKLLDGGEHEPLKERKSFFRRLAEKKGSPRIDWEDVICVRKI